MGLKRAFKQLFRKRLETEDLSPKRKLEETKKPILVDKRKPEDIPDPKQVQATAKLIYNLGKLFNQLKAIYAEYKIPITKPLAFLTDIIQSVRGAGITINDFEASHRFSGPKLLQAQLSAKTVSELDSINFRILRHFVETTAELNYWHVREKKSGKDVLEPILNRGVIPRYIDLRLWLTERIVLETTFDSCLRVSLKHAREIVRIKGTNKDAYENIVSQFQKDMSHLIYLQKVIFQNKFPRSGFTEVLANMFRIYWDHIRKSLIDELSLSTQNEKDKTVIRGPDVEPLLSQLISGNPPELVIYDPEKNK